MMEEFPDRPKGMHWRTYDRLCRVYDAAEHLATPLKDAVEGDEGGLRGSNDPVHGSLSGWIAEW
jgi:hypothetical protein